MNVCPSCLIFFYIIVAYNISICSTLLSGFFFFHSNIQHKCLSHTCMSCLTVHFSPIFQPLGNKSASAYNISGSPMLLDNNTGSGNLTDCNNSDNDGPQSYMSVGLLMGGIVLARFGECMSCSEKERSWEQGREGEEETQKGRDREGEEETGKERKIQRGRGRERERKREGRRERERKREGKEEAEKERKTEMRAVILMMMIMAVIHLFRVTFLFAAMWEFCCLLCWLTGGSSLFH